MVFFFLFFRWYNNFFIGDFILYEYIILLFEVCYLFYFLFNDKEKFLNFEIDMCFVKKE